MTTPVTSAAPPPAAPPATAGPAARAARRPLLLVALVLLAAVVIFELAAGPLVRPSQGSPPEAEVLAIPGVAGMIHDAQLEPGEVTQVAAGRHRASPGALRAQALIDGLLLVCVLALALPRLVPGRDVTRRARLGSFIASLAILLAGIWVLVAGVARLRHLVALYLSPPFGTLSYLLLDASFPRSGSLVAISVLMALKVAACVALFRSDPRVASQRGIAGLAVSSLAVTVLTVFCYSLAPPSLGNVTDALATAVVAAVAVLWAGIIVSGSVRRLT
ncbi:MAG: hypothetical protein QOE15_1227 [Acidimicrobiaceae bacterium]|nr:hypothetical protein [Acidimicrobiaceae bacterium]